MQFKFLKLKAEALSEHDVGTGSLTARQTAQRCEGEGWEGLAMSSPRRSGGDCRPKRPSATCWRSELWAEAWLKPRHTAFKGEEGEFIPLVGSRHCGAKACTHKKTTTRHSPEQSKAARICTICEAKKNSQYCYFSEPRCNEHNPKGHCCCCWWLIWSKGLALAF